MSKPELNVCIARKVLETVDHGLVSGLGKQKPGQMCVEAAVCFAYGLPHGDNPPCVGSSIRAFKIALNDRNWSSPAARAKGMRGLAIAQLGSDVLDQKEFRKNLQRKTIQKLLPKIIRIVAGITILSAHQSALLQAANDCEAQGSRESAIRARKACYAARKTAYATADAADAAADAAYASAYATADAADAADAAYATADAATYAAYATADAADAADAAYAAAYAAYAYAYAADAADAADAAYAAASKRVAVRDEWLSFGADICLEVLKEMKSPGCEYLYLLD